MGFLPSVESLIPHEMLDDLAKTKEQMGTLVETLGRVEVLIQQQNALLEMMTRRLP